MFHGENQCSGGHQVPAQHEIPEKMGVKAFSLSSRRGGFGFEALHKVPVKARKVERTGRRIECGQRATKGHSLPSTCLCRSVSFHA